MRSLGDDSADASDALSNTSPRSPEPYLVPLPTPPRTATLPAAPLPRTYQGESERSTTASTASPARHQSMITNPRLEPVSPHDPPDYWITPTEAEDSHRQLNPPPFDTSRHHSQFNQPSHHITSHTTTHHITTESHHIPSLHSLSQLETMVLRFMSYQSRAITAAHDVPALSDGEPDFKTLEVAKHCLGRDATKSGINPTLYKLQGLGLVVKRSAIPPKWSITNAGNECVAL